MKWKASYLENRILTADPIELVCMCYESAILAVQDARESLAKNDIASRTRAISKAIAIVGQLEGSLNHQAGVEVSSNLARLYRYIRERLLAANKNQDERPLIEVERLLRTVEEAWVAIRPEAASAAPAATAADDGHMRWPALGDTGNAHDRSRHTWSV